MMNNLFNTTNVTQHGIPMAQNVAPSPPQATTDVINTFLNAQQQQQLAAAVAAGTVYSDSNQLQLNVEKNYYTTTAAALEAMGTQRFYTTGGTGTAGVSTNPAITTSAVHHPSTILITNDFSHQQPGQTHNSDQGNIRIVTSTSNPLNQSNTGNLATTASGFQHSQHLFSLNSNKQLQHLFPQHLLSQSSFQPPATEMMHQQFATQPFPSSHQNHVATSAIHMPHYYVSPENQITATLNATQKITNINSNNATSDVGIPNPTPLMTNCSNANNSTVVLDRINICINNLYTDTSSSSTSNSLSSTPAQQPSPIIPAIQHKAIIENGQALPVADAFESDVLIVDEPDSTTTVTTPHTPPTTPESTPPISNINNNTNNNISTTSSINSPSTSSYKCQKSEKSIAITATKSFILAAQNIEEAAHDVSNCKENFNRSAIASTTVRKDVSVSQSDTAHPTHSITTSSTTSTTSLTPPAPPSPEMSNNKDYLIGSNETPVIASKPLFVNGEDVFIKRDDDRFYLGTVIDSARNQYLVRFDDKTEVWCEPEEMRKLGVSSGASTSEKSVTQPMCVACKRTRVDCTVEICERCARGYHRECTTETSPGNGIWLCKRCSKPMKLDESSKFSSAEDESEPCLQLHYNLESLTWDEKHRSNAEQIYCYCGKSGEFDHNMLQCWRCLNWYHTRCTQKFRRNMLRGDCFFIFCCSVCNVGNEYLRRIQASWLDLVHLVLYNLSIVKKHHKYHHLLKDINPYALEKRRILPIPKEWTLMPDNVFLDKVKSTLNGNTHLFMCGKEMKRDVNSFALRSLEPPEVVKFSVKPQDIFNDEFVFTNLKVPLLIGVPENLGFKYLNSSSKDIESVSKLKRKLNEDLTRHDVYEFEDTSDDEIPIKHMLDKAKKTKLSQLSDKMNDIESKVSSCVNNMSPDMLEKMDVEDDNANDTLISSLSELEASALSTIKGKKQLTPKKEGKSISKSPSGVVNKYGEESSLKPIEDEKSRPLNAKQMEKSSRKRKAFTLSKSYNTTHLTDSSSDENSSSSSRGTSLDLIIPPPKNFLGQNNPFRIISPKKNVAEANFLKKSVSFGIFNTSFLNFSSKLAALKSAGLFPKLSTSNLAKAAGQPRTVRTIKRRLSAKDITIGPNKEVRRRRTRRLSSNIEVISTTTINPIPTNFFRIQAKDLLAAAAASTTSAASLFTTQSKTMLSTTSSSSSLSVNNNVSRSTSSSFNADSGSADVATVQAPANQQPTHGRRLRQRPQKNSPNTSRRSSVSSNQSSTSSASAAGGGGHNSQIPNSPHQPHEDLKQTVNKYFGVVNRIESGEQFSIRAKRQLPNGQMQYLIEWGETQNVTLPAATDQNFIDQTTNTN